MVQSLSFICLAACVILSTPRVRQEHKVGTIMPFFACKGPLSIWLGEGKCLKIFNEHLFALAMRILHIPFGTKNNKVKNLSVPTANLCLGHEAAFYQRN